METGLPKYTLLSLYVHGTLWLLQPLNVNESFENWTSTEGSDSLYLPSNEAGTDKVEATSLVANDDAEALPLLEDV